MHHVLWIEDEARTALARYKAPLVRAGYSIDVATDAEEALDRLRAGSYGAYIFDLILPSAGRIEADAREMVGLRLMELLIDGYFVDLPRLDPSKVVVYTVVKDNAFHARIRELGVSRILVKTLESGLRLKMEVDAIFGIHPERNDATATQA